VVAKKSKIQTDINTVKYNKQERKKTKKKQKSSEQVFMNIDLSFICDFIHVVNSVSYTSPVDSTDCIFDAPRNADKMKMFMQSRRIKQPRSF